jgi:dolichyl-phosphate beta-glucosyltransferase
MREMEVSVVVPVYNEERRLERGLSEILGYLRGQKYSWEVVVVDDGSVDKTILKIKEQISKIQIKNQKELLKKDSLPHKEGALNDGGVRSKGAAALRLCLGKKAFGVNDDIRVVHLPENRGKGGALKEGFARARGKYIVFTDVDLSVGITELPRLLEGLEKFDVVIGSRRAEGAKIIKHQPWWREQLGRVFTWLVSKPLGLGVSDATCGFKGFRAGAGKRLFAASRISGWAYDAEILYLARKWGYAIKEMPVAWQNDEQTRVRLGKDVVGSLVGLMKIKVNDVLGKYN